jgi:hypothetical protein
VVGSLEVREQYHHSLQEELGRWVVWWQNCARNFMIQLSNDYYTSMRNQVQPRLLLGSRVGCSFLV